MKRGIVIGLLVGLALATLWPRGEATAQVPATYQITWRVVATSNGITALVYDDDVMQCVVFRHSTLGLAPTCFDRKPTDAAPVQFDWVAKTPNSIHVYHYLDAVAKCVVFQEDGTGLAPVCIDRRPQP